MTTKEYDARLDVLIRDLNSAIAEHDAAHKKFMAHVEHFNSEIDLMAMSCGDENNAN